MSNLEKAIYRGWVIDRRGDCDSIDNTNKPSDSEIFPDILDQIEEKIDCVSADVAYDTSVCHDVIDQPPTQANISSRINAILSQHRNSKAKPLTQGENICSIRSIGRKKWKKSIGYHHRGSLAEIAMFCIKIIFGGALYARFFDNQVAESIMQCKAMNKMIQLEMTEYVLV